MDFHPNRKMFNYPNLEINDIEIERLVQFNFLGLIINSKLKWQSPIDHISIKSNRYNVQNEAYIYNKFYK